jgi:hypothetical protein
MGAKGQSEPILKGLLDAWLHAAAGTPTSSSVANLSILERKVRDGVLPKGLSELSVDVRLTDDISNFIVEVQHRREPQFPQRALLYSAADIVAQHIDHSVSAKKAAAGKPKLPRWPDLKPVHTLAFCDFDFQRSQAGTFGTAARGWRSSPYERADVRRLIHTFRIQPFSDQMRAMGQLGNDALAAELAARMSMTFALLPHAPPLKSLGDVTVASPLITWASVIAHLGPDTIDSLPKTALSVPGIKVLVDIVAATATEIAEEVSKAEEEAQMIANEMEGTLQEVFVEGKAEGKAEGLAEGKAEGKAEGLAEGKAEALRMIGITNEAGYIAKFGEPPSADLKKLWASSAARESRA